MSPERLLGSGRLCKAGVASARVGMAVVGERNIIVGAERKERLGRRGALVPLYTTPSQNH